MQTKRAAIRVLIVDDHPMMRNGLKSFLSVTPGMECVGEAGTGEAALEKCATLLPDVVLMDLAMPGMGGVRATRLLRNQFPTTQVIVLTSYSEAGVVQEAVNAGAIGYLLKNVAASTLAAAVEAAAQRRPVMGPEAVQALMDLAANPHPIGSDLTERERELLQHLAEGCTNAQIAQRMSITEATVRFHIGNIFSKLEVGNRTEAVQVALRHKLVAFPK